MEELLCPHCGADLLAKQNTISRTQEEVEAFCIENGTIYFSHAYGIGSSGFTCNACNNNIDDILEGMDINY